MCLTLLTASVRHSQHFVSSRTPSGASKSTSAQVFPTFSQINDSPSQASTHYSSVCYSKRKASIATDFFESTASGETMNRCLTPRPVSKFPSLSATAPSTFEF